MSSCSTHTVISCAYLGPVEDQSSVVEITSLCTSTPKRVRDVKDLLCTVEKRAIAQALHSVNPEPLALVKRETQKKVYHLYSTIKVLLKMLFNSYLRQLCMRSLYNQHIKEYEKS